MKSKERYINRLIPAAMAGLALWGGQAFADSGIDYGQEIWSQVALSTTPAVLSSVSVVCPEDGYLKAHADTQFKMAYSNAGSEGMIVYSISLNTSLDPAHSYYLQEYSADGTDYSPASIQRIDECSDGQSVTYYFLAQLVSGLTTSSVAVSPRMSVIFIEDKI
jgi:hypothetical protein